MVNDSCVCILDLLKSLVFRIFLLGIYSIGLYVGIYVSFLNVECNFYDIACLLIDLLKISWITTLPYLFLTHLGLFLFPPIYKKPYETIESYASKLNDGLIFRFVTRGTNPHLVRDNVAYALKILRKTFLSIPNFKWNIEVVTDTYIDLEFDFDDTQSESGTPVSQTSNVSHRSQNLDNVHSITQIVVPQNYNPPNGVKYKGRALEYACRKSHANDNDWIIHLDEETRFDERTIQGIMLHALKYQENPRIGQGPMIYGPDRINTNFSSLSDTWTTIQHWFTTLADSLRVVDDFGRFRLQFEYGTSWFGIKGSYIVCRSSVEKRIGFDHGPSSSITEDAFFALHAVDLGIKFAYIDAFMYESSPFSIIDFLKQRRRWITGLWKVCTTPQINFTTRSPLILMMVFWSISFVSWITFLVSAIFSTDIATGYSAILGFILALTFGIYICGFLFSRPIYWIKTYGFHHWLIAFILQILGVPFFSMLEGLSVLFWIIYPASDKFDIVKKENETIIANSMSMSQNQSRSIAGSVDSSIEISDSKSIGTTQEQSFRQITQNVSEKASKTISQMSMKTSSESEIGEAK
ncbi:MAG: hypothetical protein CMF62_00685 [Magnetococcales bacterium]|nr:hypothetical protein [Magnetococcales bacterium]|tara:strand:- start:27849 stop:29585 length:1737 start_codon:yes stop_codon:yes gene_type:complete